MTNKDICILCKEPIFNKRRRSRYCIDCFEMKQDIKQKIFNCLLPFKLKYAKYNITFKLHIERK